MDTEVLKKALKAELEILRAMYDAIKESNGMPSGHLYAAVMGQMSLDQYTKRIDRLKSLNLITESNHWLSVTKGN